MKLKINNVEIPHIVEFNCNECELSFKFDNQINEDKIVSICESLNGPYNYHSGEVNEALVASGCYWMKNAQIEINDEDAHQLAIKEVMRMGYSRQEAIKLLED